MTSVRKRLRQAAQTSVGYGNEVTMSARRVRKLIRYIGVSLAALFTFLQLRNIEFGIIFTTISPDMLRKASLIAYYWSWIFGATFDTDVQELAYFTEKGRFKLTVSAITLIVLFGCVAAALLWAENNDQMFASVLTLFFIFNIAGFAYILWFVRPIIAASKANYSQNENYFNMAQLEMVSDYMTGSWQWKRFAIGLVLVSIMDAICFSNAIRTTASEVFVRLFGLLNMDSWAQRLPSFAFVCFVVLMDGWIWLQRAKLSGSLGVLEKISLRYTLAPLRSAPDR
jgi:hypothetical protein